MRSLSLLAALCCALLTTPASAHEFLLKPDTARPAKGANVRVEAQAAHIFMSSAEAENPADVTLELRQGETTLPISLAEDNAAKTLAGQVAMPGDGPALLVAHRKPQIWSDTTKGVLAGDRKALEAQGQKVLKVGRYEKFAKTLLNATSGSNVHAKNLGQALEIILVTNPADIKGSGDIKAQVLHRGKPMAKAHVGFTHDGYSQKEDDYMSTGETDAQGNISFTITKPGLWAIRAAVTEPVTNTPGVDKENLRTVYVFAVE